MQPQLGRWIERAGRARALSAVRESEPPCWKSHVNENTASAGGWCWNQFSAVPRISHTFPMFVLLSLHLNPLRWCLRLHPVPHLAVSLPLSLFLPSPPLTLIPLYQHQTARSCTSVQRLYNSLFPTPLSSSHSFILCLFRDLGKKIHFGDG